MREVVIEQLIGARSFTFIRFRPILMKREMFCFVVLHATSQFPRQGKPPIGSEINITCYGANFRDFVRVFLINNNMGRLKTF